MVHQFVAPAYLLTLKLAATCPLALNFTDRVPGANNGGLTFWIDGAQRADFTTIDNDTRRVDFVRLGAVAGIDGGTRGTCYFDKFESHRQSYIGAVGSGMKVAAPPALEEPAPALAPLAAPAITTTITINYTYDPLYRLTDATYSSGEFFRYTYDAVGNRLTQQTLAGTNTYTYDIANRLTSLDGVTYTWDAKGNLLSDGANIYTYDHTNRLTSVGQGANTYTFAYNGLGDRLRQTVNGAPTNYTLDLPAGLTQVLGAGTNTYLYGVSRIGEQQAGGWRYHLRDALGSVRQLADPAGGTTLAKTYEPFGSPVTSAGAATTAYGFTGEWTDATGLVYLRARYLSTSMGRFLSRDSWPPVESSPISSNLWAYADSNPVNLVDPAGHYAKNQHHFELTLRWAEEEALRYCPKCLQVPGMWVGYWIAWRDRHMDDKGLDSTAFVRFHFKEYSRAQQDVQLAIQSRDPVLLGAALHGLQDYWSHTYEGYRPPLGHVRDSFVGGCDVELFTGMTPCQRLANEELAILLSMWVHGQITAPSRGALVDRLQYLGPEVQSLTVSNLFDVWLREMSGAPGTRRAAYWKNFYGYDTDSYYHFTFRDQSMQRDTRNSLREYYAEVAGDSCLLTSFGYTPPADEEIIRLLSGG